MDINNSKEVFKMTTTAQKWGNSIGVRIPQKIARKYGVVNGSQIQVTEDGQRIILTPVKDDITLDELLAKCKGANPHPEYFSISIGKEDI